MEHSTSMPELAGVRHDWVTANGIRVHVAEIGSGPVVLLLHGFPQHWYAWRHVAATLAADHRVVMVDARGFGWSEAPRCGYDSGTRVADLLGVLDALGLGSVTICAHEWGAWAAYLLCLREPARVRGLVALNVQHPWPLHRRLLPSAWRYWYTALLEVPALGRTVLRHWPGFTTYLLGRARHGAPCATAMDSYRAVLRQPERARAGEALHRAFVLGDIRRLALNRFRRHQLAVPTIALAGRADPVVSPRAVDVVRPAQPRLDVRVVDGGHYLHEESPAVVADAVREVAGVLA